MIKYEAAIVSLWLKCSIPLFHNILLSHLSGPRNKFSKTNIYAVLNDGLMIMRTVEVYRVEKNKH